MFKLLPLSLLVFLLTCWQCNSPIPSNFLLVPYPQEVISQNGKLDSSCGYQLDIKDPALDKLQDIISQDLSLIARPNASENCQKVILQIDINEQLEQEAYTLSIKEKIKISGGSYAGVVHGLTTLWQLINEQDQLPKLFIRDQPQYHYRSIMLDVARAWHEPATIRTIIDLCRWYKINYLHLHLTDDSAFTFPSTAFPMLPTDNHKYTKAELVALNQYAFDRGVTLVPEIDVPGHSSQFIKKMPELFGIDNPEDNYYTISMAREDTDAALATLFQEIADIFTHSPYIHIGGDEAFFEGMEKDATTVAYMAKHQLPNLHELFRHFLIRMNELVKKTGKQTILWAGFGSHGELEIPKDMIVMLWAPIYHHPDTLLAEGFPIINASFKPLYVVNNRKWDPEYIYQHWNANRWESWANDPHVFKGIEIPTNDQVMGATMCAWEQHQINQLPRLRHRVASMSERLWSNTHDFSTFEFRQQLTDVRLQKFLMPFEVSLKGLNFPKLGEGNFYEQLWFNEALRINTKTRYSNIHLKYSVVENPTASDWRRIIKQPIINIDNIHLRIQAFDKNDHAVGHQYYQRFFRKPILAEANGLWENLPIGSWEKLRFENSLRLTLSAPKELGNIHYSLDGKKVTANSLIYQAPLQIDSTAHVRAQLFNEQGEAVGDGFRESYYKIWQYPSLTTGKPSWASNEEIGPGAAKKANNGRVTLWEQWGDHKSQENWVQIDLTKTEEINKLMVFTFWDNYRYYQYNIEGSLDGENWTELVDFSKNTALSTPNGYTHYIKNIDIRYLKINMLFNSANPGLHLIELAAWKE